MTKISKLSDIEIYKEALALTREIYSIARNPKFQRDYSLIDQIKRAAISVAANIAEGYGRKSRKDFSRFLSISMGSLNETITYLDFLNLEFKIDTTLLISKYSLLTQRIASFRRYLSSNYQPSTTHHQPL